MDYDLGEFGASLGDGMKMGEAIELPFPVLYTWVINGQTYEKDRGNAVFYGGFSSKTEQVDEALELMNRATPPSYFQAMEVRPKDDNPYMGYVTRHMSFVPIAFRQRWLIAGDKSGYKLHYDGNAGAKRQHLQLLVYLADIKDKVYVPFGPAEISAKGYQAKYMMDALNQWEKITKPMRGGKVPYNAFWVSIGTWGKERQSVEVGKAQKSSITPISLYLPDNFGETHMKKLFIGKDVAMEMAEYKDMAKEWLGAWAAAAGKSVADTGPELMEELPDEPPFPYNAGEFFG